MEDPAEEPAIWRLAGAHVAAVGLDPAPEGDVRSRESRHELWELVGRGCHVGVGEDHDVARGRKHARANRRALAAMGLAHDPERDRGAIAARLRLGARFDDPTGTIAAAIVDDEHIDVRRETLPHGAAEVFKELVERGPDPVGLVEGRQNDGQALGFPGSRWAGRHHRRRV